MSHVQLIPFCTEGPAYKERGNYHIELCQDQSQAWSWPITIPRWPGHKDIAPWW